MRVNENTSFLFVKTFLDPDWISPIQPPTLNILLPSPILPFNDESLAI